MTERTDLDATVQQYSLPLPARGDSARSGALPNKDSTQSGQNGQSGVDGLPSQTTRKIDQELLEKATEVIETSGEIYFKPGERGAVRDALGPSSMELSDIRLAKAYLQLAQQ